MNTERMTHRELMIYLHGLATGALLVLLGYSILSLLGLVR